MKINVDDLFLFVVVVFFFARLRSKEKKKKKSLFFDTFGFVRLVDETYFLSENNQTKLL